jgi:hypothetical protein
MESSRKQNKFVETLRDSKREQKLEDTRGNLSHINTPHDLEAFDFALMRLRMKQEIEDERKRRKVGSALLLLKAR